MTWPLSGPAPKRSYEYLRDYAGPPGPRFVMVRGDISPYKNMVDGKMITSRSEHRELLKRHNLFEVGNETKAMLDMKPPPPKTTRREKIARAVHEMGSDKEATKFINKLKKG